MPSRRDLLRAAGGAGLLAGTTPASAGDSSSGTPSAPADESAGSGTAREPTDWPMYRHDAGNSGAVDGADVPLYEPGPAWSVRTLGEEAPAVTSELVVA